MQKHKITGLLFLTLVAMTLPAGQALPGAIPPTTLGCAFTGPADEYFWGYGEPGVPATTGWGDGACEDWETTYTGVMAYTVLKNSQPWSYTEMAGCAPDAWECAVVGVFCDQPAALLVDWTTSPPTETYLTGSGCEVYAFEDISSVEWQVFGGGYGDTKFVHTDSLADALVELLT